MARIPLVSLELLSGYLPFVREEANTVLSKPRPIAQLVFSVLVVLAALTPAAQAARARSCPDGTSACVKVTIDDMTARYNTLASACDHRAIFSLAYLLTTQQYKKVTKDPAFFHDTPWVNREDWNFAQLYLNSFDGFSPGGTTIPPAWQIAFDAAHDQTVSGGGDLLLGINAHVNRDLPFALYALGLVAPDGSSRKPDHDKVDVMLRQVLPKILALESKRFDPTIPGDVINGTDLDMDGLMSLLVAWRETAWDNAVLLATAPDVLRPSVANTIEQTAATQATAIVAGSLVTRQQRQARNAYCATHWNAR
jgi:hypothetical protein